MIVLGLNMNHADSSACLIKNGEIIAGIEEERFSRIKHHAGFPINSIEFCLRHSDLNFDKVDFITLNYNPKSNEHFPIVYR